jgi:hypothetical protein
MPNKADAMKPSKLKSRIHRDLYPFLSPGGLFDVPPSDLDLYVGHRCVFRQRKWPADEGFYVIVAVQRLYDDTVGFRVTPADDLHGFGRAVRPEEIEIL